MRHSNDALLMSEAAQKHTASSQAELIKAVEFRDLLHLNRRQIFTNVTLSWPWLLLGWALAWQQWYVPAVLATGMFYMLALRQAHDCYHGNIGLSPNGITVLLHLLSMGMLCATHAIGYTHLQHHKHKLNEHDIEGSWSRLSAFKAIALGGIFYYKIQHHGLKHGSTRTRRHARIDVCLMAVVVVIALWSQAPLLIYHVLSMLLCSCLVGFFAVWSVHHDCDGEHDIARTERKAWVNFLTAHLLYHVEHHLFPAVPCNHLPQLAKRLDAVAPHLTQKRVI